MRKTLRLNNLKTRTAMNENFSVCYLILKRSHISYIICLTVALSEIKRIISFRSTVFAKISNLNV